MKIINILLFISLIIIIFLVFKAWFLPGLITAGDFWPYSKAIYDTKPLFLHAWDLNNIAGLGGNISPFLWIYFNFGLPITIFGKLLGLNWNLIERFYFLFPFIILSTFSSYFLFSKLFNKNFAIFSSAVFVLNSYILMVVGGGQIPGIGMAYSIFPLVIYFLLKADELLENSFYLGFILSVQVIFDLRIAYISGVSILLYWIIQILENKSLKFTFKSALSFFITPGITAFLLNAFWIFPTIANGRNPVEDLGTAYSSIDAVKFLSFARLENSIALMHPNWPENIFGKTEFMRPEFLILPIIAFSSLLFLKKEEKKKKNLILYFSILAILGAFLAKGASEPLGGIYLFLFDHLPGFIMFRDPTKWYTFIAISYSILIPFTVWKIFEFFSSRYKNLKYLPHVILIIIIGLLLFTIKPALSGNLSGTFKSTQIPNDYIKLEKFLLSEKDFSRILWVPSIQRFGFYSNIHPAIPAQDLFKSVDNQKIISLLEDNQKLLKESGIKYLVVPLDSQGEIYLKDRKYNNNLYNQLLKGVSAISYLKAKDGFGKIRIFEISNPKDHFWTPSSSLSLKYKFISPVEYTLEVKNAKRGDIIVFSEKYDARWIVRESNTKLYDFANLISSNPYNKRFNSFILRKNGDYSLVVYYYPQLIVNFGVLISILSLILIIGFIIYLNKKK